MDEKIKNAMDEGESIANKYNAETRIPFPFKNIFDEENISLLPLPDKEMWKDISGAICLSKKEEVQIFVNEEKPENRQYFTIAHELGHYFLHEEDLKEKKGIFDANSMPTLYRTDIGLSDRKEREADHFAGSLLMPKKRVKEIWKKFGDIERCANIFSVSQAAMAVRLEILNVLEE